MKFEEYQKLYLQRLKEILARNDKAELAKESKRIIKKLQSAGILDESEELAEPYRS